jgi:hypothetical protein
MTDKNNKHPSCFGMIDRVFPIGEDSLRSSPESCLECICKTECLRSAMAGSGGLTVHEELVDRAYESGMIGFLGRWSKKKDLDRKIKAQKAKPKDK